jgi:ribosomal protein S13
MARLAGVDLPRDKRVEVALTYIYGIGKTRSTQMLTAAGVNPNTRVVVDFQFVDKEHTPTQELVKVRAKPLPAKRLQ